MKEKAPGKRSNAGERAHQKARQAYIKIGKKLISQGFQLERLKVAPPEVAAKWNEATKAYDDSAKLVKKYQKETSGVEQSQIASKIDAVAANLKGPIAKSVRDAPKKSLHDLYMDVRTRLPKTPRENPYGKVVTDGEPRNKKKIDRRTSFQRLKEEYARLPYPERAYAEISTFYSKREIPTSVLQEIADISREPKSAIEPADQEAAQAKLAALVTSQKKRGSSVNLILNKTKHLPNPQRGYAQEAASAYNGVISDESIIKMAKSSSEGKPAAKKAKEASSEKARVENSHLQTAMEAAFEKNGIKPPEGATTAKETNDQSFPDDLAALMYKVHGGEVWAKEAREVHGKLNPGKRADYLEKTRKLVEEKLEQQKVQKEERRQKFTEQSRAIYQDADKIQEEAEARYLGFQDQVKNEVGVEHSRLPSDSWNEANAALEKIYTLKKEMRKASAIKQKEKILQQMRETETEHERIKANLIVGGKAAREPFITEEKETDNKEKTPRKARRQKPEKPNDSVRNAKPAYTRAEAMRIGREGAVARGSEGLQQVDGDLAEVIDEDSILNWKPNYDDGYVSEATDSTVNTQTDASITSQPDAVPAVQQGGKQDWKGVLKWINAQPLSDEQKDEVAALQERYTYAGGREEKRDVLQEMRELQERMGGVKAAPRAKASGQSAVSPKNADAAVSSDPVQNIRWEDLQSGLRNGDAIAMKHLRDFYQMGSPDEQKLALKIFEDNKEALRQSSQKVDFYEPAFNEMERIAGLYVDAPTPPPQTVSAPVTLPTAAELERQAQEAEYEDHAHAETGRYLDAATVELNQKYGGNAPPELIARHDVIEDKIRQAIANKDVDAQQKAIEELDAFMAEERAKPAPPAVVADERSLREVYDESLDNDPSLQPDTPKGWRNKLGSIIERLTGTSNIAVSKEGSAATRAEQLKQSLDSRSQQLDVRMQALPASIRRINRIVESYNKMHWSKKLGISAALVGGGLLTAGTFPMIAAAIGGAAGAQRVIAGYGLALTMQKKLDAHVAKDPDGWISRIYNSRTEAQKAVIALTVAAAYMGVGAGAIYGATQLIKEGAHVLLQTEWLGHMMNKMGDVWDGLRKEGIELGKEAGTGGVTSGSTPKVTPHAEVTPGPGSSSVVAEKVPTIPTMAHELETPAEGYAIPDSAPEVKSTIPDDLVGEGPKVIGPEATEVASVHATKGKGYEYMLKSLVRDLQVRTDLDIRNFPEGSDIRRLLEVDPTQIDAELHKIAAENHYFDQGSERSVLIKPESVMSVDANGDIWVDGEPIFAADDAKTTPPYHPSPKVSIEAAPSPEVSAESAASTEDLIRAHQEVDAALSGRGGEAGDILSQQQMQTDTVAAENTPEQASASPSGGERPPMRTEAVTAHFEKFVTNNGFEIDPTVSDVYKDAKGNFYAYGNSYEQNVSVAQEVAKKFPGKTVWVQAHNPTLYNGELRPWVTEISYTPRWGGLFHPIQEAQLEIRGVVNPSRIGAIDPNMFVAKAVK